MKRRDEYPVFTDSGILSFAVWAGPPKPGTSGAAECAPRRPTTAAPGATPLVKRPPQLKSKPNRMPITRRRRIRSSWIGKAADDFATKFPDSEVRVLLYEQGMRLLPECQYADKTDAMGRKVLSLDSDNPEALVTVAESLPERTRDSDIEKISVMPKP